MKSKRNFVSLLFLLCFPVLILFAQDTGIKITNLEIAEDNVLLNVETLTGSFDADKMIVFTKSSSDKTENRIKIFRFLKKEELANGQFTVAYQILPEILCNQNILIFVEYDKKIILNRMLYYKSDFTGMEGIPVLISVEPEGGVENDNITISGKNFGSNMDDIRVILISNEKEETGMKTGYYNFAPISPISITQENQNDPIQKLTFNLEFQKPIVTINKYFFNYKITIKVVRRGHISNYLKFNFVNQYWQLYTIIIISGFLLILLILIYSVLKKRGKLFLVDPETNKLSLSQCQAFAWTVVFLGSYLYLIIGKGLFLGKSSIPDFNPSLLGIMMISYGGLLTSQAVTAKSPQNKTSKTKPGFIDLISKGEQISLPRLQLLGFTIVSIIAYLYYLSNNNLFSEGLPNIPSTLLGLMGISQAGYIGGIAIGNSIIVSFIEPKVIKKDAENVAITLVGKNFTDNTKILIEGSNLPPIDTNRINANCLTVNLPVQSTIGQKNIIIIPPTDNSYIYFPKAFEVVANDTDKKV